MSVNTQCVKKIKQTESIEQCCSRKGGQKRRPVCCDSFQTETQAI